MGTGLNCSIYMKGPPPLFPNLFFVLIKSQISPFCLCLSPFIETLDKGLEDLLTRVDEFVGMLDMIRSDSSQVVNENVPHIHAKAVEMRQLYRKIDKLEAFVKMVGNSVSGMEEQITKAESDLGTFPNTFKKLLHTINVPSFLNKSSSSRQNSASYEPSDLFKTEDYFPCLGEAQNK
uniref:Biogenesis of lysosomal organelles complex 1 subunit 4 n=1 Tax=Anolis carolinensis TaxID=28377 RepID=A0A803SX87_ANOCA